MPRGVPTSGRRDTSRLSEENRAVRRENLKKAQESNKKRYPLRTALPVSLGDEGKKAYQQASEEKRAQAREAGRRAIHAALGLPWDTVDESDEEAAPGRIAG